MIRFVIIAAAVAIAWLLLLMLFRQARAAQFDWTGIAAIVGFIALAFYLRHVTGMG
ncbi:hypothetical protein ACFFTN_27865 [Aminobacter aganoensis]|uniref:Uncharacterized protein n=1 Tax=Aminobacter aganoensis TaxID=83264 RepID=A0A7X0F1D8_9HYPH|nr:MULTISPECIES: hypothetical protein [Aminobacter]MBB6352292.1 hypothetical protein [Aminobacter aganoensis]